MQDFDIQQEQQIAIHDIAEDNNGYSVNIPTTPVARCACSSGAYCTPGACAC